MILFGRWRRVISIGIALIILVVGTGLLFSNSSGLKYSGLRDSSRGSSSEPKLPQGETPHEPKLPQTQSDSLSQQQSDNSTLARGDPSYWKSQDIKDLEPSVWPDWNTLYEWPHPRFPTLDERTRNENAEVWRNGGNILPQDTGIKGLHRYKPPERSSFSSDSQYLRAALPGDFRANSDKAFFMFKTGADTQWHRMPIHFMTDLAFVENFALYSDAPGSIFGHEVVDILGKSLSQDIILNNWEFDKYRAHLQSHEEHWHWPPERMVGKGGWELDRFKNIPMLWDAYQKNPNCDWYVWVDDDSYVFYDNMMKWLETMDPNQLIYTGALTHTWYEEREWYFAHGGSVIVVSRGIADALFGANKRHNLTNEEFLSKWNDRTVPICCGDAILGIMLGEELGVELYTHPAFGEWIWYGQPFQGEPLSGLVIEKSRMCVPILTWHHMTPHDMETVWEYERLWPHDRWITYDDLYRDNFLPYIVEERPNWKISDASGFPDRFPKDGMSATDHVEMNGNNYRPAFSKEECKRYCTDKSDCYAWTWRPEFCMITHAGFVFGAAASNWNQQEDGWVSGWMVDRIREWRAESPCDPLEKINGVWNDNDQTSEGWYIRQLRESKRKSFSEEDSTL